MTFDNNSMIQSVDHLNTYAKNLKNAGNTLIANLTSDLSTFSSETKDVLMKRIGTVNVNSETPEETLAYFAIVQVPSVIESLAKLLEANRQAIEEADSNLASQL